MSTPDYRDLIWDLAYDGPEQEGVVELRLFSSEQEMYETGWRPTQWTPIVLALDDMLKRSRSSQSGWPRSRGPSGVLREVGQQIWDAIPDEAKHPMLEATPELPCRLKISSESSAMNDLPWEWLNDGADVPFALQPQMRLARSVPIRLAMPPMSLESSLRVLLVITNPKDERLLHPLWEIEAIRPSLRAPSYDLTILEEPTWPALVDILRTQSPHVVHYIGHTGIDRGEGNLILHSQDNVSHWISGPDLASALPPTVRLLSLSTCFTAQNYQILGLSRLAHASAIYRLPTTVTNRYPVEESSVRTFWRAFYSVLADHGNVNEAFYAAQNAVALESGTEDDWGSFSLVIRDQSGKALRPASVNKRTPARHEEVQVQLAAELANNLAERILNLGADVPASLERLFKQEEARADELTNDLYEREQP